MRKLIVAIVNKLDVLETISLPLKNNNIDYEIETMIRLLAQISNKTNLIYLKRKLKKTKQYKLLSRINNSSNSDFTSTPEINVVKYIKRITWLYKLYPKLVYFYLYAIDILKLDKYLLLQERKLHREVRQKLNKALSLLDKHI